MLTLNTGAATLPDCEAGERDGGPRSAQLEEPHVQGIQVGQFFSSLRAKAKLLTLPSPSEMAGSPGTRAW